MKSQFEKHLLVVETNERNQTITGIGNKKLMELKFQETTMIRVEFVFSRIFLLALLKVCICFAIEQLLKDENFY